MHSSGTLTADPNPILNDTGSGCGATTLSWEAPGVSTVEVRVGAPDGPLLSRTGARGSAKTGDWVTDGMVFYLQDVSAGLPLTAEHTLATASVKVAAVRGTQRPGALILMYHRVVAVPSDPWSLCVTPQHFAEQLEVLRQQGCVLPLRQLGTHLRENTLPDRAVVITFDDGYVDNLQHAKPLLERYELPATVFLTSGAIGNKREFWWDELERLLLQPGRLPPTLCLKMAGEERHWDLGAAADYHAEAHLSHQRWHAWGEPDPSSRHALYRALYQLLYPLEEKERRAVQAELLAWAGVSAAPTRANYLPLTQAEALALMEGGLIEAGAHTVTHSQLAALSPAAQAQEIRQSKHDLEALFERPITNFAYPFGKRSDYTEQTVALVREAGFSCACSNFAGVVHTGADQFQLPRVHIGDWDGEEFERQLAPWLAG